MIIKNPAKAVCDHRSQDVSKMEMVGKTISHFKILEKLGEGGMGTIYKAEDTKLNRTVALRFLPAELTKDPAIKRRLIHETQAASALQYNNICSIHDTDETGDGQLFIVTDCYEGESLKGKIARGSLRLEEVLDIAVQICQAMTKTHAKEIVHGELKPSLFSSRTRVRQNF